MPLYRYSNTSNITHKEAKNMSNEIEAFLSEIEVAAAAAKTEEGPRKYVNRERLVVTIDEESGNSGLHKNYILEGFTPGIEGNYGTSTAVRVVEPDNGRRMTLWLGSHEQDHFQTFVQKQLDEGKVFPMDITFLRHKQTAQKSGRQYNRFSALCNSWGDDVVVPPVPADQMVDADQSEA
jgi:hypothetical protein